MNKQVHNKNEKVLIAFRFFERFRQSGESFNLNDIAVETGWSQSTVRTYSAKRWAGFLKRNDRGYIITQRFDNYNESSFIKHHSQTEVLNNSFYQLLVEKSISACISAIEVYNKPDFKFREENFSILMINSWELLLKAKILEINNDNKESIYEKSKGTIVLTSAGVPKTITVTRALNLLCSTGMINNVVAENIKLLIEIRDNSVHFVHSDSELSTKIQCIGTASLKNLMTLCMNWFDYDFRKYNFYLMPLSLFHISDMESFSVDPQSSEKLKRYLSTVESEFDETDDPDFSISLRLETKFVKTSNDEALQVRLSDDPDAPEIQIKEEDSLRNHKLTYGMLLTKMWSRYSDFKRNEKFNGLMRNLKEKGEVFCKERKLDPKNPKSIHKVFYSDRIFSEMDKHYQLK